MKQIQCLYELQKTDSSLDTKRQRLDVVLGSLGETDALRQARGAVRDTEADLARLQTEQRALELEIRGQRDKLQQNQDRLYGGRVRNPKELSSLQDEAAALRRRMDVLEESQLELMIETEDQQALLEEQRTHRDAVENAWQAEQARLCEERDQLRRDLAELQQQRDEQVAQVDWEALDLYEELRAQLGGAAVALMREGVCEACGVAMSVIRAQRVYQGQELVQCGACNRLLFGRR